ncbi:Z1 domain-containing protein [Pontibacter akesuensis]|uniref:Z1 domain-containing protein n=1 Tax=Pontibacter akesuensis TaxID=388950 RepID=A0A1I7JCH6_9BACT|nr:Z1 domain-containing protein [Pontibacter akesuensis]GHA71014.1 endonuclease [Pontibacter akesuensis]SFU82831.1 Z1 domain-containing protein [Pontibacter akesuensis]
MLTNAIKAVKALLPESGVTPSDIDEQTDFILSNPKFKDVDRDLLISELRNQYTMVLEGFRIIELDDPERRKPWVASKKVHRDNWPFWLRYKNYLMYNKGFAPSLIDELDRLTDRILDGLFDPTSDIGFDKKGLVVGQVQSGKTSNYTGLISKAADAGYNLIIVLAGLHNNLRSQTQLRIDEGFLGFDTQYQRAFNTGRHLIGVGVGNSAQPAHSITDSSEKGDFSTRTAGVSFNTKEPIIAVVKKNSSVLKKLYQWLHNHSSEVGGKRLIQDKTLLVIDDEADNASINTKKNPEERTTINNAIRQVLDLFSKNAYVGYTATPFANIFIPSTERDNLFPRDFIVNIPPPPSYIGPEKVFGFDFYEDDTDTPHSVLPIVNRIDSTLEDKTELELFIPSGHKMDDPKPTSIPESLRTAIKCFILTCAVRKLRGQKKEHNSMLVHVTRFKKWQFQIKKLVEEEFNFYKNGIDLNIPSIIAELRQAFEQDSPHYCSYITTTQKVLNSPFKDLDPNIKLHSWEDVEPFLYEAVINTRVKEINGGSGEALDYYENKDLGLSVIAIGGDKLSRGLTLEGLSVSYYLRASKMYDTLMQMGRWFGYRHGYADLCRLFTTGELNEWFCHITRATQELRDEFDYMANTAGSSPEKYAVKVRTHPGVLQISASNKIRSAVPIEISWAGRLVESYELVKDYDINSTNLLQASKLYESLILGRYETKTKTGDTKIWYDVPPDLVLSFFDGFRVVENLKAYNPENLSKFINQQIKNKELTHWRVAFMSKSKPSKPYALNDLNVGLFVRNEADPNNHNVYYIRKSHIIDKKHESIDLEAEEYDKALRLTEEEWENKKKKGKPQSPSGEIVRNEIRSPENPLLMLYFLDPDGTSDCREWDIPIIGYAISFPRSNYYEPVTYAVNSTLLPYFDIETNTLDFDEDED